MYIAFGTIISIVLIELDYPGLMITIRESGEFMGFGLRSLWGGRPFFIVLKLLQF